MIIDVFALVQKSCELFIQRGFQLLDIKFRLCSGLKNYVAKGGKVGRKKGSVKPIEQRAEEYKDIIVYLKKGYSIRVTAKLSEMSISTVQRVKKDFQL